eukprot:2152989-Prymnesium_polylepis.1
MAARRPRPPRSPASHEESEEHATPTHPANVKLRCAVNHQFIVDEHVAMLAFEYPPHTAKGKVPAADETRPIVEAHKHHHKSGSTCARGQRAAPPSPL